MYNIDCVCDFLLLVIIIMIIGCCILFPIFYALKLSSDYKQSEQDKLNFRVVLCLIMLAIGLVLVTSVSVALEQFNKVIAKGVDIIVISGYILAIEKFYELTCTNLINKNREETEIKRDNVK